MCIGIEDDNLIGAEVSIEHWELKEPFVLSRGSRTHAEVVYLKINGRSVFGHSECQPNKRYGETAEAVKEQLTGCFPASLAQLEGLITTLASFSARNALDCALWDYKFKLGVVDTSIFQNLHSKQPISTYFTLSVAGPDNMANAAASAYDKGCRRLKLKFAGKGDDERLEAVRSAAPDASLIIDANEAWSEKMLVDYLPLLEKEGVDLLEQPLPAGRDGILKEIKTPVILCADESCHTKADIASLVGKYGAVNIKLDKAGGITSGLELYKAARAAELKVMVGCMLGTSLAVAPAFAIASQAEFVDLDAPLLLAGDREFGFKVDHSFNFHEVDTKLWGHHLSGS